MKLILIFALFQSVLCIDFQSNGYRDVIVTIHPDVSEANGQDIINNIQVKMIFLGGLTNWPK